MTSSRTRRLDLPHALVRVDRTRIVLILCLLILAIVPESDARQTRGRVISHVVHASSLEDNLAGTTPDRNVHVYLPPSYDQDMDLRYPVVYVLSGIFDRATVWLEDWDGVDVEHGSLPALMDSGIESGRIGEMILVIPDVATSFSGEFYANSPVKGNWEDFIVDELRTWVESSFRTIDDRRARGLLGHSMGGHGAIRLGLLHPDLFGVVYGMNPGVMGWGGDLTASNPAFKKLLSADEPASVLDDDFYAAAIVGIAQAFSPDPGAPPLYMKLPFRLEGDEVVPNPTAHTRWERNFPVNMIDTYLAGKHRLVGLRFDSAFEDEFSHIPPTTRRFSETLREIGVPHTFEMYNGDHRNRLWGAHGRLYRDALPYLSDLLVAPEQRP